jgi:peroxiredoxin
LKFDEKKNYWYLPENDIADKLSIFYFVINYNDKKHSFDLPIAKKGGTWVDMHNLYKAGDGDIIFKQDNFQRGQSHPKISITGNDADYSKLCTSLDSIIGALNIDISSSYKAKILYNYKTNYGIAEQKLQRLMDNYGNKYGWLFPDIQMAMCDLNPIMLENWLTRGTPDGEAVRFSEDFINIYRRKALILKGLEKSELMLTPRLIQELQIFPRHYMPDYGLYDELNIPYGYFEQFLDEVGNELDDDEMCGKILFEKADRMVGTRPDMAKIQLIELKKKYPNYSGVKNGSIDKVLKTFNIVIGSPAPEFSVLTLDGKEVSLASLKGKYVFLDFWGTWCGPCVGEIPNVKKLHESISADELVVIGVCSDNEKSVRDFIEKNDVKYNNAMASDKIMSDYGIRSFPTTYLIGKNGEIVGKNFRGSNLVDMVKAAMQ